MARAKPKRDRRRSSRRNRRPVSQVMGPTTNAAARHPRPVRDGATISASGGQADAAVGVSTFQKGGVTSKGDMILMRTTLFSQRAEPSPLWLRTSPKRLIRRGTTRISGVRCEKAVGGCASRVPPVARRNGAPHGRGAGGESDPTFFGAGTPPGRVKVDRPLATFSLLSAGVALTTVIPGGKAVESASKPTRTTADHRWPQAERGKPGACSQADISDR